MVVTTGGFQSWRCLTSGISNVSRYPSADPDTAAKSRAPRATVRSFFGWRQNGTLGGGPPGRLPGGPPEGPEGWPPRGEPRTGGRPPGTHPDGEAPGLVGGR